MSLVVAGKGPAFEFITDVTDCTPVHAGEDLADFHGDVLLSIQYDRIVTAAQLSRFGQALNLHFGVLPQYRGCFPTKWAIINGDDAGVTLHHMSPLVDQGPIVDVRKFSTRDLTDAEVYDRCNLEAVFLFHRWRWEILGGRVPTGTPQDEREARYYPRIPPYYGRMPEDADEVLAERLRRAFTHFPYPSLIE